VIEYGPADPEKPSRGTMSPEKAKRLLGWSPQYDLDRGMEATINWYKEFLNV
jgi:nucleoside-diphosphate-sugar epimerase